MSLNAIPLMVMPSVDPALAFHPRMFAIYDGGREISYTPFYAQNVNNGNIHVDFNPPDQMTAIYPQFYTKTDYRSTFVGVGPGLVDPLLTPGVYDAPRAFPTQATTGTVDLKLNGTAVTSNVNAYFHQLMRLGNQVQNFDLDFSLCPSMLDSYQEYIDWETFGSARNPMALWGENSAQAPRGAFLNPAVNPAFPIESPVYNYQQNTHTNAVVTFSSVEPVMISPFYHSKSAFFAKTFNGTWTFTNLNRIWSHATGPNSGVISSMVTNIVGFTVYLRFISAKELSKIPRDISYDYHEILPLSTTLNVPVAAGASAQISMNSVNLDAIPKRLVFVVKRQDADLITGANNFLYSDSTARLDQITINWANNQGKLSSASPYDLYNIYRNNGGNESWPQWSKFSGSVLPIDLGRDIGLSSLDAPSKLSNPQLSATVNFTNISTNTITFTLTVIVVYEGTFAVMGGNVTKNIAVLTSQDILNSEKMDNPIVENTTHRNMYGGNVWDKIKSGFSSVNDFLKKYKPLSRIGSIVPHSGVQTAARVARAVGYGDGLVSHPPYYYNEELAGGRKKRKKKN